VTYVSFCFKETVGCAQDQIMNDLISRSYHGYLQIHNIQISISLV